MVTALFARALRAAPIGLLLLSPATAHAEIRDYEFRLDRKEVALGEVELPVRLFDKRTGQNLSDAVIFAWRLDMAPDGMEDMSAAAKLQNGEPLGTYRFKAKLPMRGHWRLSLAGKVQGELGTVRGSLTFEATK